MPETSVCFRSITSADKKKLECENNIILYNSNSFLKVFFRITTTDSANTEKGFEAKGNK